MKKKEILAWGGARVPRILDPPLIDCSYVPHAVSGTQVAYAAAQYSSLSTILPLSQYFKILLWS